MDLDPEGQRIAEFNKAVSDLIKVEVRLEMIETVRRRHWFQLGAEAKLSQTDQLLLTSFENGVRICKRGHVREKGSGRCQDCHGIANDAYIARRKAA